MLVRTFAFLGAAAAFAVSAGADANAFFGHRGKGKIVTCYKKVMTPPVYRTVTERVMVRPASCSSYRTPPTYGTVAQQVTLQPSYQVVHSTPAVYGRVQVQKMVRPERTRWVRGRCHDGYKCAVTTPARYRTRTRRVMMEPAQHWVETKPAVKGVVHQKVMLNAGELRKVCQPAEYQTVTRQVMVSPGTAQWVPVQHSGHSVSYHQTPRHRPVYRPAPMSVPVPMK